ncbi:MAG: class I SAM-dependent methyltransferase [Planctomycetes bacterium]|nr:class I SAM-dependent methyltransferase [Planctomycetota bacterium]
MAPTGAAPMTPWRATGADPNAPLALVTRRRALAEAWAPPVHDRNAYLEGLARGRRVLDVGVVDHTIERAGTSQWLHGRVAAAASYAMGVDVLPEHVDELRRRGFNARVCDITREDPGERFDLVVCGEVIEHLDCPGALLAGARRCLGPDGQVVLTSPNPYYLPRIRDALRGVTHENVDHVTYVFPSGLVELAARAGLRLVRWRGVRSTESAGRLGRALFAAGRALLAPEAACYSLIYECAVDPQSPGEGRAQV